MIDFKLPDGSGLDVAERIRLKWGATPIILISGYDPAAALRAQTLGISDFLEKPFSREMICEAVKKAVGSPKGRAKIVTSRPASISAGVRRTLLDSFLAESREASGIMIPGRSYMGGTLARSEHGFSSLGKKVPRG